MAGKILTNKRKKALHIGLGVLAAKISEAGLPWNPAEVEALQQACIALGVQCPVRFQIDKPLIRVAQTVQ